MTEVFASLKRHAPPFAPEVDVQQQDVATVVALVRRADGAGVRRLECLEIDFEEMAQRMALEAERRLHRLAFGGGDADV